MRKEEDLERLLEFLEKCVQDEDVIRHPYEVCVDCRKAASWEQMMRSNHEGHTFISQDTDHSGVSEWIKCLRWVLEK